MTCQKLMRKVTEIDVINIWGWLNVLFMMTAMF